MPLGRCYLTGKPQLSIPCYGERRYGHAQDDELVMALPAGYMEKGTQGSRGPVSQGGAVFPSVSRGAEGNLDSVFARGLIPPSKKKIESTRNAIPNGLVAGLTGVIASGKKHGFIQIGRIGGQTDRF